MKSREKIFKNLKTLKKHFVQLEDTKLMRNKQIRKILGKHFSECMFEIEMYINALELKSGNFDFVSNLDMDVPIEKLLHTMMAGVNIYQRDEGD